MNAVIYARVSTNTGKQDTERQVVELQYYALTNDVTIVKIYEDYQSGATKNEDRWVLKDCMKFCADKTNKVDCVLISEVTRLGRDVWEMLKLILFFHENSINVYFLKENLFLYDNLGNENSIFPILFAIHSSFAENERALIKKRLQSGYKNFRDKGGKVGRKKGSYKTKEQLAEQYKDVIRQLKKGTSLNDTAKLCGISKFTVIKIKKTFKINFKNKT